jgi:hypothetical protein
MAGGGYRPRDRFEIHNACMHLHFHFHLQMHIIIYALSFYLESLDLLTEFPVGIYTQVYQYEFYQQAHEYK